jgi:NAD(P) transhydrogenase subunit alpha
LRLSIPRESAPLEKRVAATPESVAALLKAGFEVSIEAGAGVAAGYTDAAYAEAGATVVAADVVWGGGVVVKVRPPSLEEVDRLAKGAVLISLLQPERRPDVAARLAERGLTALALERVPRVTRAQKMDVLSSMANLSGYRAVVEGAAHFQGFFGPQMTAAGASPPARVLIIGAGVAGLAAIGAAKALGAEVRAFDTRSAAREQVESLGAKFLEVLIEESGDGGGGYAKVMSPEFIAAEMALFREQAREVDIIITTALVPGTKAPILLPEDVVACLRPGSVIVDMAAEQGGNCALTRPDEVVVHDGVTILGFTDLPSRMAHVASRFFARNMVHLLTEMGGGAGFKVDFDNDVIRPALYCHDGAVLPPAPKKEPSPAPKPVSAAPQVSAAPKPAAEPPPQSHASVHSPARIAWGTTIGGLVCIALLFVLGRFAPPKLLQHSTVFVLACFVGWQVVWSVTPALHTPLMSVTNAISGIIIVGGMLQIGSAGVDPASVLGAAAVLFAAINIAGGFLVTQRMLRMFRRNGPAESSPRGHGGH